MSILVSAGGSDDQYKMQRGIIGIMKPEKQPKPKKQPRQQPFSISGTFEQAMEKIVKAEPERKPKK